MEHLRLANPLHPLACLFGSIGLVIAGLIGAKDPQLWVFILAVCALHIGFGMARAALWAVAIFIPVGAVFGAFSYLFSQDLTTAVQMAGRVLVIGVTAVPVVTLPPINLTRALGQLGVPRIFTLGLLIAVRFVPIVASEVQRVSEAMRTRGVRRSFWRTFTVPLMVRLIGMSDTMTLSLETRAFALNGPKPSCYLPLRWHVRDAGYLAFAAALVLGWGWVR